MLGRSTSLGASARGAGVGLLAARRGLGWGASMIDFAAERARTAGLETLEFLAEPERLNWYERLGFTVVREELALLHHGTGGHCPRGDARSLAVATSDPQATEIDARPEADPRWDGYLWSWVPEHWRRTPPEERLLVEIPATAELPAARAWLSSEGRAQLVHRLSFDGRGDPQFVAPTVARLLSLFPAGVPVLLYPCPALPCEWLLSLLDAGWSVSQRSFVVMKETPGTGPGVFSTIGR